MRIFIAGATGAIGRKLVPMLVEAGHHVTAITRSEAKLDPLRAAGAESIVCDVFDAKRLHTIVADARPEILIHQLTDLPPMLDPDPARFEEQFAGNNLIRREGTTNLVDAAASAGVRRIVAQSIAFVYAPVGGAVKSEDDPLFDDAPLPFRQSVEAVRALESAVLDREGIDGVVLRYGYFYGPGTFYASDGSIADLVRRGELPIVQGEDLTSFVQVEDAAAAAVLALDGPPGIYNVVDDEPALQQAWLPVYAEALGAPLPPKISPESNREDADTYDRGASNVKAKRLLGWSPRYPSWRDGFRVALG